METMVHKHFKMMASMVENGLASFSLFPRTDYMKSEYLYPSDITKASWEKTGVTLYKTIEKVGPQFEHK